tara:strand:+ start:643 stop:1392 length:750 start_codon:yes stop_codon:yes gene_type:complete
MDNKKFNKLIKEALTPDFLKEDTMPSQGEVNSFFEHTWDDLHYLNSKPVGEWDEYDLSNWESKKRKRVRESINESNYHTYDTKDLIDIYRALKKDGSPSQKKSWLTGIRKELESRGESVNEDARGVYADIPTLNKHPDILNLIKNVQELVGIEVEADLRGYGGKGKGFYLTTPSLKFWEDDDKNLLKDAFNKTNNESGGLTFEFQITDNYEMDPGERSWDAAFGFTVDEKDEGSELYPGTMGDEISAPR